MDSQAQISPTLLVFHQSVLEEPITGDGEVMKNLLKGLHNRKLWPLSEAVYGSKTRAALFGSAGGVLVGLLVGVLVVAGSQQGIIPAVTDESSKPTASSSPEATEPSAEPTAVEETAAPGMKIYKFKVVPSIALKFYEENGMTLAFDSDLVNGVLSIEAPDEETADLIRMTFTDITMWEKVTE